MILVDNHCHLMHAEYKDVDALIERSKEAGVKAIVCSGVNVATNREALALAKKYAPLVRCSLGIYPVDALGLGGDEAGLSKQEGPIDLDKEFEFMKENKDLMVGVGEVGLDYHWVKEEELQKKQRENFSRIIEFVEKIKKPIIIHSRKAEADCIEMLESSSIKNVILHCFGGRKHLVKKGAELGYYFSIPSIIKKLDHFKMIAEIVSINQLLTETDGPWLSPESGRNSEPRDVIHSIENIAKIKSFTEEEVANNVWLNFQRVYS